MEPMRSIGSIWECESRLYTLFDMERSHLWKILVQMIYFSALLDGTRTATFVLRQQKVGILATRVGIGPPIFHFTLRQCLKRNNFVFEAVKRTYSPSNCLLNFITLVRKHFKPQHCSTISTLYAISFRLHTPCYISYGGLLIGCFFWLVFVLFFAQKTSFGGCAMLRW